MAKKPNVLILGIDSLRADHMSLYGYEHLTTPHIDKYVECGTVFTHHFSPSIPTTSGYASMLTGLDCFGANVVALRHEGDLSPESKTLAETLRENGYNTTCIGFKGNIASRGFDNYIEYENWGLEKAAKLNAVAIPELKRLADDDKPFFMFLRHMDPHSPYLPPVPFDRAFYDGDECDPDNHSMDSVYDFKPFCDYFSSWVKDGCTDKDYVIAQYDGAVAYMDACISNIFMTLEKLGIEEETLVVITSDHGETLYDHDCYFDHHGLYDCTLYVPMAFVFPGKVPQGHVYDMETQHKDIVPTILKLLGIKHKKLDGRSMTAAWESEFIPETEMYITECTWMRKHGWRTPEWKLIHALEPDFHFKPEVELYNLIKDPMELHNVADENPDIVGVLEARMQAHIAKREKKTGRPNPMYTNTNWHGAGGGFFTSSQQAYDTLHIGDVGAAKKLQAKLNESRSRKEIPK